MVYFQFGNLDFMGSVSGNEAKNAQQHKKQLMNKLFIFVLNYGTNHIQTFNLQNYRVSKRNCSILSRTPCKDAQKIGVVKISFCFNFLNQKGQRF